MSSFQFLKAVCVFGILLGCSALPGPPSVVKEWEPVGARAPMIGSPETPDLAKFVVGTWQTSTGIDKDQAQQLGLSGLEPIEGDELFTFAADGKLTVRGKVRKFSVEGSWAISGDTVTVDYKSVEGKSMDQAREELKRGAESGTQAGVARELKYDWILTELTKLTSWQVAPDKQQLFCNASAQDTSGMDSQIKFAAGTFLSRQQEKAQK